MSTSLGDLFIPIKAVVEHFRGDVEAEATASGKSAGEKFSESFNEAGKRLVKGFIGAELILKTVDMFKDAIQAAREDQLATDQLTTAIRANSVARADDIEQIEKQAAALAELGFTDNEVKASLTSLVTATGSLDKALQLQNVATDLARAKHISLQDASQQLVAVEAGRFRGLAQLGIQIDAHATKEEALAAIRERVAGQAATFAATDEGATQRRNAAYDKLLETIGSKLTPILTDLANFETTVLIPAGTAVADNLATFTPILEGLALALSVKVVGGFAAARLSALEFGGAMTVTATTAASEGAVIEGAARGAQAAWRSAIATILVLPELMNLVGDAYESVRKTVFGANPVIAQWTGLVKGSTGATKQQTDALTGLIPNVVSTTSAILDNTAATDENANSTSTSDEYAQHYAGVLAVLAAQHATAAAQAATSAEYTEHYGNVTDAASDSAATFRAELAATYGITISDAQAALFLARGMNAAAAAAQNAAAGIAAFRAGHPTNAHYGAGTADAQVQFNPGSINTETSDFDPEALIQHNIGLGPNVGYVAPKKTRAGGGGRGGAGGKSQATKDAEAQAKALHDKVVAAFEEAKTAGDAYYDSIHTQNQKAISDAHDLARNKIAADHEAAAKAIEEAHREANERITAGRAAVNAQLAEQRRLNAAPVTEAERAQQAIEDQRRLRDLQEQLATAQASGDAKAQRSAQEALQSFAAQQNIAALSAQQAAADAAAQDRADAQNAALDEQQKDEDARYEKQKADEDARVVAKNAAEDTRYATQQHDLEVRDARQKKEFDDHIAALEDSKKATIALAQATEKKYLQDQLALAQKYGTAQDVKFAQQDLAAFLKGLPRHASGGYVPGPQLAFIGESGPEWVIPDRPDSPAAIAARAQFGGGGATRTSNRSQTVNIYNPAPEPAGMDTHRYLQALAAFGS